MEVIESIKPDHLILLGDTFDFKWGIPSLHDLVMFFGTLKIVKPYIHVIKGCCDSEEVSIMKALSKLVLEKRAHPLILRDEKYESEELLKEHILNLIKFYGIAKERMIIKNRKGEIVYLLHGHKVIENPKENIRIVEQLMREYKSTMEADWLIIGHIHRAFIDYENQIASPGCWQAPPIWLKSIVTTRDIKRYIIINNKGDISLELG